MNRPPYLFVFCIHTGKPWSEEAPAKKFRVWMEQKFKRDCPVGIGSHEQSFEFSCAYPTRSGSICMMKGQGAVDTDRTQEAKKIPREQGRVIIALRRVYLPSGTAEEINSPPSNRSQLSNFWFAFRVAKDFVIQRELFGNRESDYRRRPGDIHGYLDREVLGNLRAGIKAAAKSRFHFTKWYQSSMCS